LFPGFAGKIREKIASFDRYESDFSAHIKCLRIYADIAPFGNRVILTLRRTLESRRVR